MRVFWSEGEAGAVAGHLELGEGQRRREERKASRRRFRMLSRSVGRVRQIWARVIRECLAPRMGLWRTKAGPGPVFEVVVRPSLFPFPKEMSVWRLRGHLQVSTSLTD